MTDLSPDQRPDGWSAGAAGYLGSGLVQSLSERAGRSGDPACIVASDLREVPPEHEPGAAPSDAYGVRGAAERQHARLCGRRQVARGQGASPFTSASASR